MKAVVMSGLNGRKFVNDKPVPRAKQGELVVEVRAFGLNPADYKLQMMALLTPGQVLGFDVAGIVKEVGEGVNGFVPGDRVFGFANGAYAEYALCKAASIVKAPECFSFTQCAAIPVGFQAAYQVLTKFGYKSGQRLVIIGASGGTGTAGVILGRAIGGPDAEIIAVCSGANEKLVKDLGANRVIDYTKETPLEALGPKSVDFVYDVASFSGGGEDYFSQDRELIKDEGISVSLAGPLTSLVRMVTGMQEAKHKLYFADQNGESLNEIVKLLQEQHAEPVISKVLTFNAENVEEGIADLIGRRTKGKIVLTVGPQN